MKKIAIFVEGLTEELFAEKLLLELAGKQKLVIEKRVAYGGGANIPKRTVKVFQAARLAPETRYFALIFNCKHDERVASDIRDRYQSLIQAGHTQIIGIRDVYPLDRSKINTLRHQLALRIPTKPVSVAFILGILETESWFIAEHTHFQNVHHNLNFPAVCTALGYDPSSYDIQLRDHPALDLHSTYSQVGLTYHKNLTDIRRTVNALDYAEIFLTVANRFPDLQNLVNCLDSFLAA